MSLVYMPANRYPSPVSPPREDAQNADQENLKMLRREESHSKDCHSLKYVQRFLSNSQRYERAGGGSWPPGGERPEVVVAGRHEQRANTAGYQQRPQDQDQAQGQIQSPRQVQDKWRWSGGADWRFQAPPAAPPPEAGYEQEQPSWYARAQQQPGCWTRGFGPALFQLQLLTPHSYTEPPAQLNPRVSAFAPASVSTVSLMKRWSGVNKHARYNTQPGTASVSANALLLKNSRKKAPKPQTRSRKFSESSPRLHLMKRPLPTADYIARAAQPPQALEVSRPLLVVLDLNGTLLYRKNRGATFIERPHLTEFLEYLFSNHKVMVWSSARPENVYKMCRNLFTPEQHQKVVAVWARDRLGLTLAMYSQKVQVYKQLSWIFNDPEIQAKNPQPEIQWSQANTVLIDDTTEKAASEPHNIVQIEEFEAMKDQMEADVLGQVALYLDILRSQQDASSYIRSQPFTYDPKPPPATPSDTSVNDNGGVALASL